MKKLSFDTSSLIASAQFSVANRLIIQHILGYAEVVIPEGVKEETVDQGLPSGYPDAQALDALVKGGSIQVEVAHPGNSVFEQVIDAYGIENGDAEKMLDTIKPRYRLGFIEHARWVLRGVL